MRCFNQDVIETSNNRGYSAIAIANYFALKGLGDGYPMVHMALQKLTFIAHGWYLAFTNKPLVNEEAQAWGYGPVFESLYKMLRNKLNKPVTERLTDFLELDEDVRRLLDIVYERYGDLSTGQLVDIMTTKNTPWTNYYIPFLSVPIRNEVILEHFTKLLKKKLLWY